MYGNPWRHSSWSSSWSSTMAVCRWCRRSGALGIRIFNRNIVWGFECGAKKKGCFSIACSGLSSGRIFCRWRQCGEDCQIWNGSMRSTWCGLWEKDHKDTQTECLRSFTAFWTCVARICFDIFHVCIFLSSPFFVLKRCWGWFFFYDIFSLRGWRCGCCWTVTHWVFLFCWPWCARPFQPST